MVAAVSWGVVPGVREAQYAEPDPGGGPPNKMQFLRWQLWWPSIHKDVKAFQIASTWTSPSSLFLSPNASGPTSPWILTLASLLQKVKQLSLLLWADFIKLHITLPCPNCHLPGRVPHYCWNMFFVYMDFPEMLCLTGVL